MRGKSVKTVKTLTLTWHTSVIVARRSCSGEFHLTAFRVPFPATSESLGRLDRL